jgi:hypothetical protein
MVGRPPSLSSSTRDKRGGDSGCLLLTRLQLLATVLMEREQILVQVKQLMCPTVGLCLCIHSQLLLIR